GTGPGGRVTQEDVDRFRQGGGGTQMEEAPESEMIAEARVPENRNDRAAPARPAVPVTAPAVSGDGLPDFAQWGPIKREPAPQIRKAIARQMLRAWLNVPRVTHGDDADLTDL